MPLEPAKLWQQTLKDVEQVDNMTWAQNMAKWLFERVNAKLGVSGILGPVTYTFNQALFMAKLMTMPPVNNMADAAKALAEAWEQAVLASNMAVMPGACFGAPTPATTWSAPICVIDPASVSAAKAQIMAQFMNAELVDTGMDSKLPEILHQAFMTITFTTSGINMTVPPTPLMAPCLPGI
jgi:hypothetical protein